MEMEITSKFCCGIIYANGKVLFFWKILKKGTRDDSESQSKDGELVVMEEFWVHGLTYPVHPETLTFIEI